MIYLKSYKQNRKEGVNMEDNISTTEVFEELNEEELENEGVEE